MTLRSRLFGAIGIALSAILAVLVAVTLSLEWSRVQRIRGVHETAVEFAASLAASVPYEAYRDTLLLRDGELHESIASLAVFGVDRRKEPEPEPSAQFGEIATDPAVLRRALPLVRRVLETGDGVREGVAVAVLVPRGRAGRAGSVAAQARPQVVFLELRPLELDPVTVSRVTFLVIVASGALLLLGTWLIVDRVVVRPLRSVVSGAQRVAEGNYAEPVPDSGAQDEIQMVVESFNAMMRELGTLHERMQERIGYALRRAHRTQDSLVIAQRLAATGTLAAGIAHEVNNPLGGMLNAVHALRTKEMKPERREEYLGLIEDGLTRIQQTVAKILRFTPHSVAPQAVDLADVVQPALALVRHRFEREGVELVVTVPDAPAVVFGDFYELQQALLNVVLNALDAIADAGREDPRIDVVLEITESEIQLTVRDNGTGMDEADVPRAFDLFFTTKEQGKGTGLGLATVHKILDDHGGRVVLQPRPGEGLDVTFVLPRHSATRR